MLRDIVRGEVEESVSYELEYMYDDNGGFGFPCDENGNPDYKNMQEPAIENLKWCRQNPDKFKYNGRIHKRVSRWRNPDYGKCKCGNIVYLVDQYYGACECDECGQWYNLSGQELLPPSKWGWDGTPW